MEREIILDIINLLGLPNSTIAKIIKINEQDLDAIVSKECTKPLDYNVTNRIYMLIAAIDPMRSLKTAPAGLCRNIKVGSQTLLDVLKGPVVTYLDVAPFVNAFKNYQKNYEEKGVAS